MGFRDDFMWGAATSAYQIEGAAYDDGKGLNIWDVFCKEEGRVYEGHTGDVACDHYHRFCEDVAIMKEMGLKAYRFSINWARILPSGTGLVNEAGIQFYSDLIDELLAADITPFITLYHWDLPYELYKKGGWMNSEIVNWFGEYAKIIVERYSDRVKHYFTLNEPQCFIGISFLQAEQAPGLKVPIRDTFQMSHNVLKAHGMAVKMMRVAAKQDIEIGYAPTGTMSCPATDQPEDIEAAKMHLFGTPEQLSDWTWNVAWWSDPVILGEYPEEALKRYYDYLPEITKADLELISQPLDFYGQNIYNGQKVKMGKAGKPEVVKRYEGFPRTAFNWPVTPECLYWGAKFLGERYKKPLYITENGLSCHDVISLDGKVHDPNRIDFLARYLGELGRASDEGCDIRGYFQWSFMDNFEWAAGYSERFGMVYVDYATQKRIIKDSGHWYQKIISENGKNL